MYFHLEVIIFMISMNFSREELRAVPPQATIPENLTDNQDINIFQFSDDLSKVSEFNQNHITKYQNTFLAQINYSGLDNTFYFLH